MKTIAFLLLSALTALAGIELEYKAGEITAQGYLALPESASAETPVPGVIVVHEWWGHNDYARKRADMIAELGYAALAIDMYGKGKATTHPKDAGAFAREATAQLPVMKERFLAGMKTLQERPEVDGAQIVSIGYCMGGKISLQMAALQLENLVGAASFHGALNIDFPEETQPLKARLLVCNGADDSFIPPKAIAAFTENTTIRKADLTFLNLPEAVHGFSNPSATELGKKHGLNIAYNKTADQTSWKALEWFLKGLFES